MRKILKVQLFFILLATPCFAQVTASFSPQPYDTLVAVTHSKPRGIALHGVRVCNHDKAAAASVSSGLVYDAAQAAGVSMVSPLLAPQTLAQAAKRSKAARILAFITPASHGAALLISSKVIAANPQVLTAIIAGSAVLDLIGKEVQIALPDTGPIMEVLLRGQLAVAAGACEERLALAQYVRGLKPFQVEVK